MERSSQYQRMLFLYVCMSSDKSITDSIGFQYLKCIRRVFHLFVTALHVEECMAAKHQLFVVCVSYHDCSIHLNCLIANGCKCTYSCVCPTGPISFHFWQFQILIMGSDWIFDMTWKCLGRLNRHINKTPDLQLLCNLIFSHVKF